MSKRTSFAVDKTITLGINRSTQRIRLCATRTGLPPLLIVQAGPGLPVLNEVAKLQQRLRLEQQFLVAYWEQRGCGAASREDAMSACFQQQVDDLRQVLRWLHEETKQTAVVLGISVGATIVLRAVEHEPDCVKAVVAVSVDTHTVWSDAAADAFLQEQRLRSGNGPPQPKGEGTRKAALRGSGRDSAARQAAGRSRHHRAREDVQRAVARGAVQHDPHVWCCRRCQGSPQHQHRAAHDAARVGPRWTCLRLRHGWRSPFIACSASRTRCSPPQS